jgi:hypothetical protein
VRRLAAAALIFAGTAFAATAERPKVTRADVANMEKVVNDQIQRMFPEEPWVLLGFARGFYVNGVGVVFSADVNLATGPAVTPFTNPRKELLVAQHEKKQKRLPVLRERMYTIVRYLGTSITSLPEDEQVVLCVSLMRSPWEIGNDIPAQIVMHVQRGKLVGNKSPLDDVIRAEEY